MDVTEETMMEEETSSFYESFTSLMIPYMKDYGRYLFFLFLAVYVLMYKMSKFRGKFF